MIGAGFTNTDLNGCWLHIGGTGLSAIYENEDSGAQLIHYNNVWGLGPRWWTPDTSLANGYFGPSASELAGIYNAMSGGDTGIMYYG